MNVRTTSGPCWRSCEKRAQVLHGFEQHGHLMTMPISVTGVHQSAFYWIQKTYSTSSSCIYVIVIYRESPRIAALPSS
jgi:hypothetical protein